MSDGVPGRQTPFLSERMQACLREFVAAYDSWWSDCRSSGRFATVYAIEEHTARLWPRVEAIRAEWLRVLHGILQGLPANGEHAREHLHRVQQDAVAEVVRWTVGIVPQVRSEAGLDGPDAPEDADAPDVPAAEDPRYRHLPEAGLVGDAVEAALLGAVDLRMEYALSDEWEARLEGRGW